MWWRSERHPLKGLGSKLLPHGCLVVAATEKWKEPLHFRLALFSSLQDLRSVFDSGGVTFLVTL